MILEDFEFDFDVLLRRLRVVRLVSPLNALMSVIVLPPMWTYVRLVSPLRTLMSVIEPSRRLSLVRPVRF